MTDDKNIYIPSSPLRTTRPNVLTTFELGVSTLEADYQTAPPFELLPSTSSLRRMSRSRCETGA